MEVPDAYVHVSGHWAIRTIPIPEFYGVRDILAIEKTLVLIFIFKLSLNVRFSSLENSTVYLLKLVL